MVFVILKLWYVPLESSRDFSMRGQCLTMIPLLKHRSKNVISSVENSAVKLMRWCRSLMLLMSCSRLSFVSIHTKNILSTKTYSDLMIDSTSRNRAQPWVRRWHLPHFHGFTGIQNPFRNNPFPHTLEENWLEEPLFSQFSLA